MTHQDRTDGICEKSPAGQPPAGDFRAGGGPAPDGAAGARRARFGTLPDRVRPEDTVETRPALPRDPARDAYNPDEWLVRYCG